MNQGRADDWFVTPEFSGLDALTRCSGLLSVLGATYLGQDILKDETRRRKTINRVVLAMSSCDIIYSCFGPILGTLMVPSHESILHSMGNQSTCNLQGMISTWFLTSSLGYQVELALTYSLIVTNGYSDERLRKIEPLLLLPPLVLGFMFGIIPFMLSAYNFNGTNQCMIYGEPMSCTSIGSDINCARGDSWRELFFILMGTIASMNGVIGYLMYNLYKKVINKEREADQFRFTLAESNSSRRALSRAAGWQGLWFSASYFITIFPSFGASLVGFAFGTKIPYWLGLLSVFTLNCLGLSNAIVYVRPRYAKFKKDHSDLGFLCCCYYVLLRKQFSGSSSRRSRTNDSEDDTDVLASIQEGMRRICSYVMRRGSENRIKETEVMGENSRRVSIRTNERKVDNQLCNNLDNEGMKDFDEHRSFHAGDSSKTSTLTILTPNDDEYFLTMKREDDIENGAFGCFPIMCTGNSDISDELIGSKLEQQDEDETNPQVVPEGVMEFERRCSGLFMPDEFAANLLSEIEE
jgi:hypothetical protein